MSDIRAPQQGRPMMEQLRSPMNPTDAVMAAKRGEGGGTFGEVMERMYGVRWDEPAETAFKKILQKQQMASPEAKTQAMASQGSPGMAPRGNPGGSAIGDMMNRYGR